MLAGRVIPTRCDCTNLQKLYEDCLKGLIITDDRNVAKIFSEKLYGEKDEIIIKVYTLQEFNYVHCIG
jgi:Holliday junction resolvase RusA-like endonuclease